MDCKTIGSQDIFLIRAGLRPLYPHYLQLGASPPTPHVNTPQNPQNFQITIKVMFAIKCRAIHWAAILLLRSFCYDYLSCYPFVLCPLPKFRCLLSTMPIQKSLILTIGATPHFSLNWCPPRFVVTSRPSMFTLCSILSIIIFGWLYNT